MFTCPNALWIGDGGGSWSPAQLSLGSSCLLSGCCCSLHDVTFLGSFWCNEFLFVKHKSHKMLTVYIKHIFLSPRLLNSAHVSIIHLADFLCCLASAASSFPFTSDCFVPVFFFLFFSDIFWWSGHSLSDGVGGVSDMRSQRVNSPRLSGTWVFLWRTLVCDSSNLCEMLWCTLAWDDWMGHGKTSQRKCMWEGTWAMLCGWGTEPETLMVGNSEGPGAGGQNLWASVVSGWAAVMCEWVSLCENWGGWVPCCSWRAN